MIHFKLEPKPITQEQKDWYETHMKRETRPYESVKDFLERISSKEWLTK
jgi:hypothetical protein